MIILNCPNCQSDRITKNGSNKSGTQQYRCKDCHKSALQAILTVDLH